MATNGPELPLFILDRMAGVGMLRQAVSAGRARTSLFSPHHRFQEEARSGGSSHFQIVCQRLGQIGIGHRVRVEKGFNTK